MSTRLPLDSGVKKKFLLANIFSEEDENVLCRRKCNFCSEVIEFKLNSGDAKLFEHIDACKKLTKEDLNQRMLEKFKENLMLHQNVELSRDELMAIQAKNSGELFPEIMLKRIQEIFNENQLVFSGELRVDDEIFRVQVLNEGNFDKLLAEDVIHYVDERFVFPPGRRVIVGLPAKDGKEKSILYTMEITDKFGANFMIKDTGLNSNIKVFGKTALGCYAKLGKIKEKSNKDFKLNLANYGYAFGCKPIPPSIAADLQKLKKTFDSIMSREFMKEATTVKDLQVKLQIQDPNVLTLRHQIAVRDNKEDDKLHKKERIYQELKKVVQENLKNDKMLFTLDLGDLLKIDEDAINQELNVFEEISKQFSDEMSDFKVWYERRIQGIVFQSVNY